MRNFVKTDNYVVKYNSEILNNFSKCKLQAMHMKALGWKWGDAKDGIPNAEEIHDGLIELAHLAESTLDETPIDRLNKVSQCWEVASGGFHVTLNFNLETREVTDLDVKFNIWN